MISAQIGSISLSPAKVFCCAPALLCFPVGLLDWIRGDKKGAGATTAGPGGDDPTDVRQHDSYYIKIAEAVRGSEIDNDPDRDEANCWGSKVGAVIVLGGGPLGRRVVSTGYNGTPSGFPNCLDGGCVRCERRRDDPSAGGIGLDRCVCVHAEQNALLSAARFGIAVEGATIYTTLSPCFGCLKESIQAGIKRIVYLNVYNAHYEPEIQAQYDALIGRLRNGNPVNFEPLGGTPAAVDEVGQFPDPSRG
jgi:dCMP deaminase